MAQQGNIKIPRASDRSVIDFFREIGKAYGVSQLSIVAQGSIKIGAVNLEGEPSDDFAEILDLDSALIATATLVIDGFAVAYHRGGAVAVEAKSPIFDEVATTFNPQNGNLSNVDRLKITEKINSKLHGFQPGRQIDSGISKEQGDLIAIHQASLERLEKLNEDLVQQGINYRESLDKKFDKKAEKFENDIRERQEKLNENIQQQEAGLDDERQQLEARRKEIDDRDNTHVRRELRKSLLEELKARSAAFALTKGTQHLRLPIHFTCILFFAVAAGFAYNYSTELFKYVQGDDVSTITSILLSLKSLGFTFAAVATGIFYMRWLNQWFSQHAEAEFKLKQFQLDIERASWVVETVLEMKAGQEIVPTALLNSLTKNLFEYETGRKDEELNPADELASALLGTASNVKVKAGDSEITFAGKDIRKQLKRS